MIFSGLFNPTPVKFIIGVNDANDHAPVLQEANLEKDINENSQIVRNAREVTENNLVLLQLQR